MLEGLDGEIGGGEVEEGFEAGNGFPSSISSQGKLQIVLGEFVPARRQEMLGCCLEGEPVPEGTSPPAPRAVCRGFAAKPGLKPVLNRLRGAAELCQGDLSSPEHSELQGLGEVKARPKWGGGEGLWSRCGENLESSGGCGLGLGAEGAQEEGFGAQSQQRLGLFVHQS